LPVDEFKDLFDLDDLPWEDQGIYQTLAGFVVMQLGRIPVVADYFEWEGLKIEVVDMDGNRVDKVLVTPTSDAASDMGAAG
jgi:putative hemolysin